MVNRDLLISLFHAVPSINSACDSCLCEKLWFKNNINKYYSKTTKINITITKTEPGLTTHRANRQLQYTGWQESQNAKDIRGEYGFSHVPISAITLDNIAVDLTFDRNVNTLLKYYVCCFSYHLFITSEPNKLLNFFRPAFYFPRTSILTEYVEVGISNLTHALFFILLLWLK